jgi:hypothetical protein
MMMQVNTITEEKHRELIESLRNSDCMILNQPLPNLEESAIEKFKYVKNTLENHRINKLPSQYEFTSGENILSWLSYYDKSLIIGVGVPPEHGLLISYILQIYDGWYKQHKSIVQNQFLEYASQCTAISINGSIFNPINCVDAFCDWYIRSNIGSLNFGLALDINEDNIYCFTIKIQYDFVHKSHTPQVLEEHLGEFFNEKAQKYLFPISTPPALKEIEGRKGKVGRPKSKKVAERNGKIYKEYLRLTETRTDAVAKPILLTTFKKDYFNKEYETNRRHLDRIIQKMKGQ